MKNYRITVNGVEYEVSVEELGDSPASASPAPLSSGNSPAHNPAKTAAGKSRKASAAEGSVKITAPMPGKILEVKVKEGDSVKKGDSVIVLEAMKMENEIYAGEDGQVASVEVAAGDMVEGGAVLITLQ